MFNSPRAVDAQEDERGVLPAFEEWVVNVQGEAHAVGAVKTGAGAPVDNHCGPKAATI